MPKKNPGRPSVTVNRKHMPTHSDVELLKLMAISRFSRIKQDQKTNGTFWRRWILCMNKLKSVEAKALFLEAVIGYQTIESMKKILRCKEENSQKSAMILCLKQWVAESIEIIKSEEAKTQPKIRASNAELILMVLDCLRFLPLTYLHLRKCKLKQLFDSVKDFAQSSQEMEMEREDAEGSMKERLMKRCEEIPVTWLKEFKDAKEKFKNDEEAVFQAVEIKGYPSVMESKVLPKKRTGVSNPSFGKKLRSKDSIGEALAEFQRKHQSEKTSSLPSKKQERAVKIKRLNDPALKSNAAQKNEDLPRKLSVVWVDKANAKGQQSPRSPHSLHSPCTAEATVMDPTYRGWGAAVEFVYDQTTPTSSPVLEKHELQKLVANDSANSKNAGFLMKRSKEAKFRLTGCAWRKPEAASYEGYDQRLLDLKSTEELHQATREESSLKVDYGPQDKLPDHPVCDRAVRTINFQKAKLHNVILYSTANS